MLVYQRVKGDRHCPTNMWPHCRDFPCLPILLLVSCGLVWRYVGVTSIMPVETRDDVFFTRQCFPHCFEGLVRDWLNHVATYLMILM